jgi:KUP system potassium uptake protein
VRANVEHLRVLHEHVVILSIETMPQPRVPVADRLVIDELGYSGDGIMHVTARFGYMDAPNVPVVLRQLATTADTEFPIELDTASYFLSTIELRRGDRPTMAPWRKRLFLATAPRRRRGRVLGPSPRPHYDHGSHIEV